MSRRTRRVRSARRGRHDGWLTLRADYSEPLRDQEDEVRSRLYARPSTNERTVEVLGPVPPPLVQRPAA